jgi:hypothetical protein
MAPSNRCRRAEAEIVTDVHVNPNAAHREIWLRDLDGDLVVLSEPADHHWVPPVPRSWPLVFGLVKGLGPGGWPQSWLQQRRDRVKSRWKISLTFSNADFHVAGSTQPPVVRPGQRQGCEGC